MEGDKRFSRIAWAAIPTSSSFGFLRPSNKECGNSAHASFYLIEMWAESHYFTDEKNYYYDVACHINGKL